MSVNGLLFSCYSCCRDRENATSFEPSAIRCLVEMELDNGSGMVIPSEFVWAELCWGVSAAICANHGSPLEDSSLDLYCE